MMYAGVGLECRAVGKQRVITEGVPQSQKAVRKNTTEVTTLQRATAATFCFVGNALRCLMHRELSSLLETTPYALNVAA